MYTRMMRAFVGIGSVDTVVAPDSALVGVAGPVTTPSAAACLPLQVHDLRRVSVIFMCQCHLSPRSLTQACERPKVV